MQEEPVSHDLPSGDPLNDPDVTKMVADIAQATHSGEDAVRALYVSAYETLNRDARIFCFVPLLAEKKNACARFSRNMRAVRANGR
ncbi:DUF3562 domain-containing protein [Paraburkholderia heleia]|uniref:DUF3562 domain-containing protein n=1 Tax=Paraburkholderia heleia TaxID=634127 RepID=UPI002AB77101|nr:DUF3562 domain-containing protein [Paraburkholderia heleia]